MSRKIWHICVCARHEKKRIALVRKLVNAVDPLYLPCIRSLTKYFRVTEILVKFLALDVTWY